MMASPFVVVVAADESCASSCGWARDVAGSFIDLLLGELEERRGFLGTEGRSFTAVECADEAGPMGIERVMMATRIRTVAMRARARPFFSPEFSHSRTTSSPSSIIPHRNIDNKDDFRGGRPAAARRQPLHDANRRPDPFAGMKRKVHSLGGTGTGTSTGPGPGDDEDHGRDGVDDADGVVGGDAADRQLRRHRHDPAAAGGGTDQGSAKKRARPSREGGSSNSNSNSGPPLVPPAGTQDVGEDEGGTRGDATKDGSTARDGRGDAAQGRFAVSTRGCVLEEPAAAAHERGDPVGVGAGPRGLLAAPPIPPRRDTRFGWIRRMDNEGGGGDDGDVDRLVSPRSSWSPHNVSPTKNAVGRFEVLEQQAVLGSTEEARTWKAAPPDGFATTTPVASEQRPACAWADESLKDDTMASRPIRGELLWVGWRHRTSTVLSLVVLAAAVVVAGIWACADRTSLRAVDPASIHGHHVLIPRRPVLGWQALLQRALRSDVVDAPKRADLTLRQVLADPEGYHLALAPAFFGFYGYFGALAAWEEELGRPVLEPHRLLSVAGASAGAMAAVLLASQIPPRTAAAFVSDMTLDKFADFPGILAAFRGNKFEAIMEDFLRQHAAVVNNNTASAPLRLSPSSSSVWTSPQMQHSSIPVAVSAFDIQTFSGRILRTGSMARAARASATFPFLFQPVGYRDHDGHSSGDATRSGGRDYLLIDGGLTDFAGLQGTRDVLQRLPSNSQPTHHTVINLSVGDYVGSPPGPSYFEGVDGTTRVVSISLQRLPPCGPWAMSNGPTAVDAALKAMRASLDVPMFLGRDPDHYELHIDARGFWK
jgi:Patatin-like phospholipase